MCGFLCSAATDNRGNSNLVERLLTTKFPLCILLMELAMQVQVRGADLRLHWLPRLQNEEADSLTNGDYSRFDSRLCLRFDLKAFKGIIMQDLMRAGMDLYEEVRDSRAHKNISSRSDKRPTSGQGKRFARLGPMAVKTVVRVLLPRACSSSGVIFVSDAADASVSIWLISAK